MFHRALDIQGAITTMDVLNIDDDLRFTFKLLFFLYHRLFVITIRHAPHGVHGIPKPRWIQGLSPEPHMIQGAIRI
jgi:hypothetical protein